MKIAIFSFIIMFAFAATQTLHAKTLIVSDIDDTIKLTDVLNNKTHVVFNGVFKTTSFSGMSELYQDLDTEETIIHYVSGSPKLIKHRVVEFLEENDFPQRHRLSLKKSISTDTFKYKIEVINQLIKKHSPDKIILIGDDTEFDPEIYNVISIENPKLVEAIYIRTIQNRKLPENAVMKSFFSSVEIAANEMLKDRLDAAALSHVVDGFVRQRKDSRITLDNRYCPREGRAELEVLRDEMTDLKSAALLREAQKKIIKSCR